MEIFDRIDVEEEAPFGIWPCHFDCAAEGKRIAKACPTSSRECRDPVNRRGRPERANRVELTATDSKGRTRSSCGAVHETIWQIDREIGHVARHCDDAGQKFPVRPSEGRDDCGQWSRNVGLIQNFRNVRIGNLSCFPDAYHAAARRGIDPVEHMFDQTFAFEQSFRLVPADALSLSACENGDSAISHPETRVAC